MSYYALIDQETSTVTDLIEGPDHPEGYVEVPDGVVVGMTVNNGDWYYEGEQYVLYGGVLTSISEIAKQIRSRRNALLVESDWVAAWAFETGNPIPQEWIDYRQALRDLTNQTGFPTDVVWPDKPE